MKREEVLAIHAAELVRCRAAPAEEAARKEQFLREIERQVPRVEALVAAAGALERRLGERAGRLVPGSSPHVSTLVEREMAALEGKKHQMRLDRLLAQKAALVAPTNEKSPEAHAWMGTRTRVHEQLQAEHPETPMGDLWTEADALVADAGLEDPGLTNNGLTLASSTGKEG